MKKSIIFMLLILSLLVGCADNSFTDYKGQNDTMGEGMTNFDYEVPESKPSILVNQLGFYPDSVKTVLFIGDNVPESFSVVDAETGAVVYTGEIEEKDSQEGTVCVGNFSELTETGEYYILCDRIGQSYHFEISDIIYDTLFHDMLKDISAARWSAYHTDTEEVITIDAETNKTMEVSGGWYTAISDNIKTRDVVVGSKTLINLLLSCEYYIQQHSDAVGIYESGNEVPDILDEAAYEALWLLKMQDSKTGAVYSGITTVNNVPQYERQTIEACQYFIVAMAKFSYTMKSYDSAFATECLRAADAAWKYLESVNVSNQQENIALATQIKEDIRYFGATELYRASGAYRYHKVIQEYVPLMNDESMWTKEEYLGTYTYLSTRLYVRKNLCEELMKQVMDLGEAIALAAKSSPMLASVEKDDKTCENLLWNMTVITSIDYIIGNHEYDTILENNLHYILGRNEESNSYIEGYGNDEKKTQAKEGVLDNMEQTSALIFMLSEIISNQ